MTNPLLQQLALSDMNVGFARAVLEGTVDGTVWESGADAAHILHPYGMSLVWGDRVGDAFDEIVERLSGGEYRGRDEWLQIDPRWSHLPWAERLGVVPDTRLNFTFDPNAFEAAPVPAGWQLAPADASDFDRPGSVVPREFWRDALQFLDSGGGWRAERNGFRGALAFTSFRFDDALELGIETAPEARGLGLAAAACGRMIGEVLDQGLTPVWSCREGNVASHRLAEKLGFRVSARFPYFGLPASEQVTSS